MLDTILQIGKVLRTSPDGLKYHRYVKSCPQDDKNKTVLRISLPVRKDFTFDFDSAFEITDENVIKDRLFYLRYKTSERDSTIRYIFGDIYYFCTDKGKEGGGYKLPDTAKKEPGAFYRGKDVALSIAKLQSDEHIAVKRFREKFEENIVLLERLLKYQSGVCEFIRAGREEYQKSFKELLLDEVGLQRLTAQKAYNTIKQTKTATKTLKAITGLDDPSWSVIEQSSELLKKIATFSKGDLFLHFDFEGKHWYEFESEFAVINEQLLKEFIETSEAQDGYILKKSLYKTLSSADKDLQFPLFEAKARYRNKIFLCKDEVLDLMYAIDYAGKGLLTPYKSGIKIIVLPTGEQLSANDYQRFSESPDNYQIERNLEKESTKEQRLPKYSEDEPLFAPLTENVAAKIIKFDLVFSKQGGVTAPDIDLLEISGLEKSFLQRLHERLRRVKNLLYQQRNKEIKNDKQTFTIEFSFFRILGDGTREEKKYQQHLCRVLPKIYSGTYYQDPLLLPAFVKKVEYQIRNEKGYNNDRFNALKYDLYFLFYIQNTVAQGDNLMNIQQSPSYQVGLLLGKLARPLRKPIKSFEKNYVGNLSRRLCTLQDFVKFKTFVEEKLIIHDKGYPEIRKTSVELAQAIKQFSGRYDKNECAFGFFESYFTYFETQNQDEPDQEKDVPDNSN